jgi:hypothetical protein
MISTETITIDGKELILTYSDTYKIRKVGTDEIYDAAIDVLNFQYEETDIALDTPVPTESDLREALNILGVQT